MRLERRLNAVLRQCGLFSMNPQSITRNERGPPGDLRQCHHRKFRRRRIWGTSSLPANATTLRVAVFTLDEGERERIQFPADLSQASVEDLREYLYEAPKPRCRKNNETTI